MKPSLSETEKLILNVRVSRKSHHPPVTAYCIWNAKYGIRLQGYNGQKASFSGTTISVKQVGHAILSIDKYDESYLITLPSLHIDGLISGSPYVELNKASYIVSTSGYTAKIDYSGRGWISGKKNTFKATLYRTGHEREAIYTVDGQWSEAFSIRDARNPKKEIESYVAKKVKTTELTVATVEQQDEMESRRAWQKVARAIEKGDMDATSAEKSLIENAQRDLRKKEKDEGRDWERRFFSAAKQYSIFEQLAKAIGEVVDADKTGGVWAFDAEKAKNARPPFSHVSLTGSD